MRKPETQELFRKFTIEIPREHAERLRETAKSQGISRNRLIQIALAKYLRDRS